MLRNTLALVGLSVAAIFLAAPAMAQQQKSAVDRYAREIPLRLDGTLIVETSNGSTTVIGTDSPIMTVIAEKIVRANSDALLSEGRSRSQILVAGDERDRILRTVVTGPNPGGRWSVSVNYQIQVPRSVHVNLVTGSGERISVRNMTGNVRVKNGSGEIELTNLMGAASVDTINGNIRVITPQRPQANLKLSSVNGLIEVYAPRESNFDWAGETLKGELFTSFSEQEMKGRFASVTPHRLYNGSANAGGSPKIELSSVTGAIYLLAQGTSRNSARSLRMQGRDIRTASSEQRPAVVSPEVLPALQQVRDQLLLSAPSASTFVLQTPLVNGNFDYVTSVGNVFVGEIRGNARFRTGAGEIILGRVHGRCEVLSQGGPLNLGEIGGAITARTAAGDISIRAAFGGGSLETNGGNVTVGYSGAPLQVVSGGGNITVRQTTSGVSAETRSGDIIIGFSPVVRSERVDATTHRGNIAVHFPPSFAADIEAVILTVDEANSIFIDFPGLTVVRDRVDGRTRIRASGKINGGGQRVNLKAEDGSIQIRGASGLVISAPQR
jgi:DUF4097 and DUF4098 domain-containing protein YvlB